MIPFAETPGGDHFCWYLEDGRTTWIAECPRDEDFATGYAPSFDGFIYRALLEEYCATWLVSEPELPAVVVRDLLIAYTTKVSETLPPAWLLTLNGVTSHAFVQRGRLFGFITRGEVNELVERDLSFDVLNGALKQHVD